MNEAPEADEFVSVGADWAAARAIVGVDGVDVDGVVEFDEFNKWLVAIGDTNGGDDDVVVDDIGDDVVVIAVAVDDDDIVVDGTVDSTAVAGTSVSSWDDDGCSEFEAVDDFDIGALLCFLEKKLNYKDIENYYYYMH